MKRHLLGLFILAMILGSASPPGQVRAQEGQITLTVEAGFDGLYRTADWIPVQVTVANNGPDIDGFIEVDQVAGSASEEARFRAPVSLPGQSRKQVTLYVATSRYLSRLQVNLIAGGEIIAQQQVRLSQVDDNTRLYGILTGEAVDLAFLEEVAPPGEQAVLAYLETRDLPAVAPAWDSLDLLIVNDTDTGTLTPPQLEAMRAWVANGGHLVVAGGPNWQKTTSKTAPLLPVTVSGSVTSYSLSALTELTDLPLTGESYIVAQSTLVDGHLLLAQDDIPLLARRREGLGTIDWLALDLAMEPLRDWVGNSRLWQEILSGADTHVPWRESEIDRWAARNGLGDIPSLALPSALQMLVFLLVYTTLIGPLNYWVLRRLRRRELAWVTIPALILLFSGLAYVTGFQLRGGEVVVSRLSLVYGVAGSQTARARSLVGVLSPQRDTYDVAFLPGAMIRPLDDNTSSGPSLSAGGAIVEETDRFVLRDLRLDVSGLRAFQAEHATPAPAVEASLTLDTSDIPRLRGTVSNRSSTILGTAGLLVGESVLELGDMAPGQTLSVDQRLGSGRATRAAHGISMLAPGYVPPFMSVVPVDKLVGGSNYWNDQSLHRRYQLLEAYLSSPESTSSLPHGVTFFAWTDEAVLDVEVVDTGITEVSTTCYLLQLPLELTPAGTDLIVPPALTTWRSLDSHRSYDQGPYNLNLPTTWASFEYQTWDSVHLAEVEALTLVIESSSAASLLTGLRVALWDWIDEGWVVDERLGVGSNRILRPGRFVGPNDAVRVRVENLQIGAVNIQRMDVTYEGVGE